MSPTTSPTEINEAANTVTNAFSAISSAFNGAVDVAGEYD